MTTAAIATRNEMRRHNLGAILRLVHVRGPLPRAELTALTGLNRSTVKALASELAALGLVVESTPVAKGAAGRPSIMVEPAAEAVFALAVDIGVAHVTAARVGLGGRVLDRIERRDVHTLVDVAQAVGHVAAVVGDLRAAAPNRARCVGVGVAVCGLVASRTGTVRVAPNLGWVDVPLGNLLCTELGGLRVTVGNEANLGALAEHMRGAGTGTNDLIYLSGNVGMGGGIVVAGRPLAGADGYAGEIGHTCVNPNGHKCQCGRLGCWETEVGAAAVLRATGFDPGTALGDVFAAVSSAQVATGLNSTARWLGLGVANLVNIFNPEMVIFGGMTAPLFQLTEDVVRDAVASALVAPQAHVRLSQPDLGQDSSLLGAAELAFAPLLERCFQVSAAAA